MMTTIDAIADVINFDENEVIMTPVEVADEKIGATIPAEAVAAVVGIKEVEIEVDETTMAVTTEILVATDIVQQTEPMTHP